jgi:two-component system, chemotaxis family, chemotaxis protein CheY
MRCLIVEDNEIMLEIASFFMAGSADIVTACNGREAVKLFTRGYEENNPFDLVLLDVVMPEMDGHMALKLMRIVEQTLPSARDKKAVIIMTTALDSPKNVQELRQGDRVDYLVKPIIRADLMAMLRRYKLIGQGDGTKVGP